MRELRCPHCGGVHALDGSFCLPYMEYGRGEHEGFLEFPLPDGTLTRCPVPDNMARFGA